MEGLETTIYLIAFIGVALLVIWFFTRGHAFLQRLQRPPAPSPVPEPAAPAISPAPPSAPPESYQTLEQRLREVEVLLGRLARQGHAPAPAPAALPSAPPSAPPARDEVYLLADQGVPVSGIARRLALSRAEVELLLELRRLRAGLRETAGV